MWSGPLGRLAGQGAGGEGALDHVAPLGQEADQARIALTRRQEDVDALH